MQLILFPQKASGKLTAWNRKQKHWQPFFFFYWFLSSIIIQAPASYWPCSPRKFPGILRYVMVSQGFVKDNHWKNPALCTAKDSRRGSWFDHNLLSLGILTTYLHLILDSVSALWLMDCACSACCVGLQPRKNHNILNLSSASFLSSYVDVWACVGM